MYEASQDQWRGRLRLVSADRTIPRRTDPLTEPERDAIEVWLPKGTNLLTHVRGRVTRDGRPVWVLTTAGMLIGLLTDEGVGRVRARAEWLPAEQLRRIDLETDGEIALLRVVTMTRRFVLSGLDRDRGERFVALVRATMAASIPARRHRPRFVGDAR